MIATDKGPQQPVPSPTHSLARTEKRSGVVQGRKRGRISTTPVPFSRPEDPADSLAKSLDLLTKSPPASVSF